MLAPDIRDIVLQIKHVCECGSQMFVPQWISFADYEIASYSLYMKCVMCNSEALAPTEVDRPAEV